MRLLCAKFCEIANEFGSELFGFSLEFLSAMWHTKHMTQQTKDKIKVIICATAVIASIALSVVMVNRSYDPRRQPFTGIGLRHPELFIIWGVATALAIFLNMRLLAKRLHVRNKAFDMTLALGCAMLIVTSCIVGPAPIWEWRRITHMVSAVIFGLTCVTLIVVLMVVKLRRKGKKSSVTYLTAILLTLMFFVIATINVGQFPAYAQTMLINVCLVAVFCSNYIERWSTTFTTSRPLKE